MTSGNPLAYCIDVDENHRTELRDSLKKKGYTPKFFSDGTRLLRYIEGDGAKFKPSLILIDLLTSGHGPFDLARLLADKKWGNIVPIIIIAKNFGPEDRIEAQTAGAITCLQKPVDLEAVLKAVEEKKRRVIKSQAMVNEHFTK